MAEVRCDGGQVLAVLPVPVRDRQGEPYEATLRLLLDGVPFGEVGERCAWFLAEAVQRLGEPEPVCAAERGVRAWAQAQGSDPDGTWAGLARHLPRDSELFCFRSRDPDDGGTAGELRACVRRSHSWDGGRWSAQVAVVLDAWGEDGSGVRVRLGLDEARALLTGLLEEVRGEPAGGPARASRDGRPVRP